MFSAQSSDIVRINTQKACTILFIHTNSFTSYRLKDNFDVLNARLGEITESKVRLEEDLKQQTMSNRTRIANMNSLKPEIKRVYMLREQYRK